MKQQWTDEDVNELTHQVSDVLDKYLRKFDKTYETDRYAINDWLTLYVWEHLPIETFKEASR